MQSKMLWRWPVLLSFRAKDTWIKRPFPCFISFSKEKGQNKENNPTCITWFFAVKCNCSKAAFAAVKFAILCLGSSSVVESITPRNGAGGLTGRAGKDNEATCLTSSRSERWWARIAWTGKPTQANGIQASASKHGKNRNEPSLEVCASSTNETNNKQEEESKKRGTNERKTDGWERERKRRSGRNSNEIKRTIMIMNSCEQEDSLFHVGGFSFHTCCMLKIYSWLTSVNKLFTLLCCDSNCKQTNNQAMKQTNRQWTWSRSKKKRTSVRQN